MKWTEEALITRYKQLDLDENQILQRKIRKQICAKKESFKRKTVWGLCAAGAMAAIVLAILQLTPHQPTYLPDPAAFNRMQFAFYRELALPGQDLGISYDDFSQEDSPSKRS